MRRRWGVRTIGFLGLLVIALIVSSIQGYYTLLTFTLVVIGLVGAAICTALGLREFLK